MTNCQQNLLIAPKRVIKVRTKNLAAHTEGAHGTLVCRGTPVEKHWFGAMQINILFSFETVLDNYFSPQGQGFES